MYNWLKESNRPYHIVAGTFIFVVSFVGLYRSGFTLNQSLLVALYVTLVAAVTKDYTDYLHGDRFDVLDVLATILIPALLTLIIKFVNYP